MNAQLTALGALASLRFYVILMSVWLQLPKSSTNELLGGKKFRSKRGWFAKFIKSGCVLLRASDHSAAVPREGSGMGIGHRVSIFLIWGAACTSACADTARDWGRASGALALGLPAVAAALVLDKQDTAGAQQLALSVGSAIAASEVLKRNVHSTRPDGSDQQSFPSRHVAVAFSTAAFVDQRYGHEYGAWVPALYGMAALTGVARVQANKHHWGDVLAGGALGYGAARLWSEPLQGGHVSVLPAQRGLAVGWARAF